MCRIIGCTGHRHIPGLFVPVVSERIRAELERHPADELIGVCSLATGADQLFARAVVATGATLYAVIPSRRYKETFDPVDRATFTSLLARARFAEALDFPEPSPAAFGAAGQRVVDLCDLLLAVWDGSAADGKGGTADAVAYAIGKGKPMAVVWPGGPR